MCVIVRMSYVCAKFSLPLEERGLLRLELDNRSGIDASEADP